MTQSDFRKDTLATTDTAESECKNLYVMTEHWQSDLAFFYHEAEFLKSLSDKYFRALIRKENIQSLETTIHKLARLENRRFNLEQKVGRHLSHMAHLFENPGLQDTRAYSDEHAKLEIAIAEFVKDFRDLKKEIYQFARQVMDGQRTSHLLSS